MFIFVWIVVSASVVIVGIIVTDKARSQRVVSVAQIITGLALASLVAAIAIGAVSAFARDLDGRYAQSPLKLWMDGLRSGNGPCCSEADGYVIADADWESKDGHYRVQIPRWRFEPSKETPSPPAGTEMIWVDVEDRAVVTEPNRAGRTMVWPIWGFQGPTVRCFMPGSMT